MRLSLLIHGLDDGMRIDRVNEIFGYSVCLALDKPVFVILLDVICDV